MGVSITAKQLTLRTRLNFNFHSDVSRASFGAAATLRARPCLPPNKALTPAEFSPQSDTHFFRIILFQRLRCRIPPTARHYRCSQSEETPAAHPACAWGEGRNTSHHKHIASELHPDHIHRSEGKRPSSFGGCPVSSRQHHGFLLYLRRVTAAKRKTESKHGY